MAKKVFFFFKRCHWNKTDIIWFVLLISVGTWFYMPTISKYTQTLTEVLNEHE